MNILPTLDSLLAEYQVAIQLLRNREELTIEQGIDLAVRFYQEVKIGAGVLAAFSDSDMLLFQYGAQNWYDGRGEYFGLDITRQFMAEDEGEQLLYQLSLEFEFDAAPFAACHSYTSWSETSPVLTDWVASQKATEGFKLAQGVPFRRVNIDLQEV